MSIEHLNAAFKSAVKPSARKFVLVALADYANEAGLAYPSIETLSNKTGQDRKTVRQHLVALSAAGFITDTGSRVGRTRQIPKYQINSERLPKLESFKATRNGTLNKSKTTKNGTCKAPENGTLKDYQKRYTEPSVFLTTIKPSVIIDYLNLKAGKNFKAIDANTKFVKDRLKEGYSLDDLRAVIDHKCAEWRNDPTWSMYLRPATLFNKTNFSQYYGNLGSSSGHGNIGGLSAAEMANAI